MDKEIDKRSWQTVLTSKPKQNLEAQPSASSPEI